MHIVYLLRLHRESLPNKYIGSKSGCTLTDGKMYSRGKPYTGSARDKGYRELIASGMEYTLYVLGSFQSHAEKLAAERAAHIKYDVVASPEYFNKAIAAESSYTNPEYATYKHSITGKCARLPRSHPAVLDGTWVGVTRGANLTPEQRRSRGRSGLKNGFYGKHHSDELKRMLSEKASTQWKGKPKTDEQRRKMSIAATKRWETYRINKEGRKT